MKLHVHRTITKLSLELIIVDTLCIDIPHTVHNSAPCEAQIDSIYGSQCVG